MVAAYVRGVLCRGASEVEVRAGKLKSIRIAVKDMQRIYGQNQSIDVKGLRCHMWGSGVTCGWLDVSRMTVSTELHVYRNV